MILAILALIVTPLVLNIIRKARTAADKRSIDAYGRSIELAIADYLLENGTFPASIEELTIEYSGDRVVCETAGLQPDDTSVYLANCKVNGRTVEGYTYGKVGSQSETYRAYSVGDIIEYKGINFYVIANSDAAEKTVTLLKAEPLTYEEIQTYSVGTGATITNISYGGMQYHSSSNDYSTSYIKIVVDGWAVDKVSNGLEEARLITLDELTDSLSYELDETATALKYNITSNTPRFVYSSDYMYWTMSSVQDYNSKVLRIGTNGSVELADVSDYIGSYDRSVRPVIVLSKSVLN